MRRAPWPVGLVLGISLAMLLLLVGPLLLFNPGFTSLLQERHGVADAFGTTQAEVDRITSELLGDIWTEGGFEAAFAGQDPLLDERERSHMHDVAVFVRILAAVALLAAVLAALTLAWLRREPRRQGRIMLLAAGGIGAVAVLLALAFAVAFEPTFLAFHAIFFPPGTYLFPPGSALITLFPEPFWFDASLAAGATVIAAAILLSLAGYWRWRSADRSDVRR